MVNYGFSGTHSANFHYNCRLISSYHNKLFYDVFTKGVIPETGTPSIDDMGTSILIPSGYSLLLSPNNEYTSDGTIRGNFAALSDVDKNILHKQILKCDIVKDFLVTPSTVESGWLVAEYNYLSFNDLPVEFSITTTDPTGTNIVVLATVTAVDGYFTAITFIRTNIAELNSAILYEMNVDSLSGYDAGYESGYIPISTGTLSQGLNAAMINGYSGTEAAVKWEQNANLNVEYLADEFANHYAPGNGSGMIPLSAGSGTVNTQLNAELLGGSGIEGLADAVHTHSLDEITDGILYNRPLGVNAANLLTSDSFKNEAFTREKIHPECFFAGNDDQGGRFRVVTGEVTVTADLEVIPFSPTNEKVFLSKPRVLLQLMNLTGGGYEYYHVKMMAHDISTSNFRLKYTMYSSSGDGVAYSEIPIETITIQYMAVGYADEDIE
jgi:hypothetical protein